MRRLDVAGLENVTEGTIRGVTVDDVPVILVAWHGEIRAFQGTCSHEASSLIDAELDRGGVLCTMHFSRFDLQTGEVLEGPAALPLVRYPVEVSDGRVHLVLPDDDVPVNIETE